ncbi:MAG: efflux RND transporter periplasmic adaptor subunit [Asticcacaulis sp.]
MTEPHFPATSTRTLRRLAMAGVAAAALIVIGGTIARVSANNDLKATTADNSVPSVAIIRPTGPESGKLVLPGRLEAWAEAPVYARTSGYLRRWYADIGTRVKAGQVLADIEAPEVDQQLAAATAAVKTATAERDLAKVTADRWKQLIAVNAVSRQDADERAGALAAREAMLQEASADVARLRALSGFKRVVAPFDGVITTRSADVGALIGSNATAPLFTVSDTRQLRLFVNVPESYLASLTPGGQIQFTTTDQPGRSFTAILTHQAGAVDAQSGAMLIQLTVDNADAALRPGAFAQVTFAAGEQTTTHVQIPSSALLFRREGTAVAVVGPDNRVQIRPITIGRDLGAALEITSGLSSTDQVVDNPSDAIATGQLVKPARPKAPAKDQG